MTAGGGGHIAPMTRDRLWSAAAVRTFVLTVPTVAVVALVFNGLEERLSSALVVKTLVIAVIIGAFAAALAVGEARRELAEVAPPGGEPDEAALARALRTGSLPDDARVYGSLRRLVDRRRHRLGRRPQIAVLAMLVGAAALGTGAALRDDPGYVFFAVVLAGTAAVLGVVLGRELRRYDRLDAALGGAEGA
jgi:hypothetical protein